MAEGRLRGGHWTLPADPPGCGPTCGLPFIQVVALCGLGTAHMDTSSQLFEQTSQYHAEAVELMELPLGTVTGRLA